MAWPKNKRRNPLHLQPFIAAILRQSSAYSLARRSGISDRTIRRWASGEDSPSSLLLEKLLDSIFPTNSGSLPLYSAEMALDGNTRTGGVGAYTLRAARGITEEIDNDHSAD